MSEFLHTVVSGCCPACGFHMAVPFFDSVPQPLVTQAWPATPEEARTAPRYACSYVRCLDCGHIYNPDFDYRNVPYSEKPNLMFNRGKVWSGIIRELQEKLFTLVPEHPVFVEIGHGDGSFLQGLKACATNTTARCIGFDPHGAVCSEPGMELLADFFIPEQHIPSLRPDMLLARHVLEHLDSPLAFLQSIAVAAAVYDQPLRAYFEVPCVDRVFETGRTTDFYYEHRSQFTSRSFETLIRKSGGTITEFGHTYQSEVVYAFVLFEVSSAVQDMLHSASAYRKITADSLITIRAQLAELASSGKTVAIWGGVGKAAAFINRYGCTADAFPLVVDSDKEKINSYVPGTGQKIVFRDELLTSPPDVIIIPAQWRAGDILLEIRASGINFRQILIEHNGRLIDFLADAHPY